MDLPLILALVASVIVGVMSRNERQWTTAGVLVLNFAGCSYIQWETGNPYPWWQFGCIDYAAAFIILKLLRQPPNLWQCAIGATYVVELIIHGAVGTAAVTGQIGSLTFAAARWHGWHFIHVVAWVQAVIMGVWVGVEFVRRRDDADRRAPPHRAMLADHRTRSEAAR